MSSNTPAIIEKYSALIPTWKASAPDGSKKNVILFESGSLCPPHIGHLSLLNCAKDWLERTMDINVVAGYLSPHADISRKFGGEEPLNARQRVQLCEALCSESSWIMVDSYRCFSPIAWEDSFEFRKGPPSHMSRAAIEEAYAQAHPDLEVEVWCLLGDDIVEMIYGQGFLAPDRTEEDLKAVWGHFSPIVCIPRSISSSSLTIPSTYGNTKDKKSVMGALSTAVSAYVCNDVTLIDLHAMTPSSTIIRKKLKQHQSVAAEMSERAYQYLMAAGLDQNLVPNYFFVDI